MLRLTGFLGVAHGNFPIPGPSGLPSPRARFQSLGSHEPWALQLQCLTIAKMPGAWAGLRGPNDE